MSSFATNTVCAHDELCPRELMEDTVTVMNRALHNSPARKNAEPDNETLSEQISNGRTLRVQIVSGKDFSARDAVAIRYDEDQVELLQAGNADSADASVTISEEHLADVSKRPGHYEENPMQLELVWVKERMTETEES